MDRISTRPCQPPGLKPFEVFKKKPRCEANAIFWDRSRWELRRAEDGDLFSVLLRPLEDRGATVRVVCSRPEALDGSRPFGEEERLLLCTDLALVGGVEAAGMMDQLIGLPSIAEELLGDEAIAKAFAPFESGGGPCASAAGLERAL